MSQIPIADRVAQKLRDIAKKMGGGYVQVGFLQGREHPSSEGSVPAASIAFWNEFGHGGNFPAPPRPFFRPMVEKESSTWPKKMAALAKATNYDGPKVLSAMGEDINGALVKSILDSPVEALSPTTLILRKRFGNRPEKITLADVLSAQQAAKNGEEGASGTQAKPLVWTGDLLRSTDYEVKS